MRTGSRLITANVSNGGPGSGPHPGEPTPLQQHFDRIKSGSPIYETERAGIVNEYKKHPVEKLNKVLADAGMSSVKTRPQALKNIEFHLRKAQDYHDASEAIRKG